MGEKINKIVIVSLYEKFSNEIASLLSQDLGMLFCSTKDMLEYEIIDKKAVAEKCSVAYLKKLEKKVIKQIASFENICVSISYELLSSNFDLFKGNSAVVFIDLPKKFIKLNDTPSYISFKERQDKLNEISTCAIKVRKIDNNVIKEKIIKALGGVLWI